MFTGKTDVEAETPILSPPEAKSWLWKDPDAGKDWRQEKKDEMVGWHDQLNAPEFEQTPGDGGEHHMPEEPGVLQCIGLQRVKHNFAT